ncbi:Copper amine oxidase N-terminal domain-containing protein [Clostridium sp. DSM 8431]|uniref:DUF2334 domain-containing protein n=1 Tax=Clostridium sp. DSM 8431 TaxID=1761781 RepID=UPI0008E62D29|nr:DUF2334 domain-containing protein [Clostridium sp. DSM 8431]SFU33631.1 Copper amine oxidase N-terminal domain-containing protein [Clostridium sp. DSM 8431]
MKKILLLLALFIFSVFCSCTQYSADISQNVDYEKLKDLDMEKDNITIKIDGKNLSLKTPIYLDKNRYYLCLNDVIKNLNGTLTAKDDTLILKVLDKTIRININNNLINSDNKEFNLKKSLINTDKFYYISFIDLSNILNIYSRWDSETNTISCKVNDTNMDNTKEYNPSINQKGFLRIEDVALTTQSYDKSYLEKLRIMGSFLSKRNVPYHIAWIPRYICPNSDIDIDPSIQNNFKTAELVYTLDYLACHKGVIGLHGYTHQRNNDESGVGSEFGYRYPSDTEFEDRINKALKICEDLDIPIDFFETPHYEITPNQNIVAEKYFKILYYPFKENGPSNIDYSKPQISPRNSDCRYISTFLDYVHENGEDNFINKIKNANINNMGSMFFHPRLDFKHIKLIENEGIPDYNYDDNSIIKRIVNALENKGYDMSSVKDI